MQFWELKNEIWIPYNKWMVKFDPWCQLESKRETCK